MIYLVTGGAGSIGSALVRTLTSHGHDVIPFDSDEYNLHKVTGHKVHPVLGNIQNKSEVVSAVRRVDVVVHLASIKRIEVAGENPVEAVSTNVGGTVNLLEACMEHQPSKFLAVSSDKAVPYDNTISLYGATKFVQEKMVLGMAKHANYGSYAVARFCNVIESRGNVFELWAEQKKAGEPITVTNPNMKRHFWHLSEAISFILRCLDLMRSGDLFFPKLGEPRCIVDLVPPDVAIEYTGNRLGETEGQLMATADEEALKEDVGFGWVVHEAWRL